MPKTVYHYCSLDSFFNIIKNKCLYASSSLYLNDSQENRWIKTILYQAKKKARSMRQSFLMQIFLQDICNLFRKPRATFIACFSENKDLLSQWREYANKGTGVAIGFNAKVFKSITDNQNYNLSFKKIIYNIDEQQILIEKILSHYQKLIENDEQVVLNKAAGESYTSIKTAYFLRETVKLKEISEGKSDYKDTKNIYLRKCAAELIILSSFLKNYSFFEEAEYRLCYFSDFSFLQKSTDIFPWLTITDLDFRVSNNKLIPYHTLDFSKNSKLICEIVLGPKCEVGIDIIRQFIKKQGISNIKINKSNSPYR
jgi:hypothetical protein